MGPSDRPGILYDLYPLTAFDPKRVMDAIQPFQPRQRHPLLALLALVAVLPLGLVGARGLAGARRIARRPLREGELPGEPARRVRAAALRDLAAAALFLSLALAVSLGWVSW
jgi:hypothetical protein